MPILCTVPECRSSKYHYRKVQGETCAAAYWWTLLSARQFQVGQKCNLGGHSLQSHTVSRVGTSYQCGIFHVSSKDLPVSISNHTLPAEWFLTVKQAFPGDFLYLDVGANIGIHGND